MARIPDDQLDRLKQDISLQRRFRIKGVKRGQTPLMSMIYSLRRRSLTAMGVG